MRKFSDLINLPSVRSFLHIHGKCIAAHASDVSWRTAAGVSGIARRVRNARQLRLFAIEISGIVLVTFAISFWSVPSALIIGGLVLVAAAEVRPHVVPSLPQLPVPEVLLRAQAEQAARMLNNVRFGVSEVDITALDRLTRDECEKIITLARTYGTKT